jgi:hypothetical protein
LPGPLPTELIFPTAGCWIVEARGDRGSALIQVGVQIARQTFPDMG